MRSRFPDSEICGSKGARPSPQLIAACYVLHRLCVPRHPPDALALTLGRSAFRSMPRKKASAGGCRLLKIRISGNGINAISLECRIKIYRPCKPANPAFTMSMIRRTRDRVMTREHVLKLIVSVECLSRCRSTKPLYHFASEAWWSQTGSNRRPHACKACALPTELWPRCLGEISSRRSGFTLRVTPGQASH